MDGDWRTHGTTEDTFYDGVWNIYGERITQITTEYLRVYYGNAMHPAMTSRRPAIPRDTGPKGRLQSQRLHDRLMFNASTSSAEWDRQGLQRDAGSSGSIKDTFYDGVGIMDGDWRTHDTTEKRLVRSGARLEGRLNLNNKHLANKSGSTLTDAVSLIVRLPLLFAVLLFVFGHGVEATSHQRLTLTAGQTGVIPIFHEWPTSLPSMPYHTIGYEDIERPFYRGGRMYPDGLKLHGQQDRLTVSSVYNTQSLSVNLTIDPVKVEDEGTFVSTVISTSTNADHSAFYLKIEVRVYTPPGPAHCFIAVSPHSVHLIYAVCSAIVGSGHTAIACYQNGEKVPYDEPDVDYPGVLTRNSWVLMMYPISCCSYEEGHGVTAETCDDFKWPPRTSTVQPTTPSPTTPTTSTPAERDLNDDGYSTVSIPRGSAWRIQGAILPMLINIVIDLPILNF